MRVYGCYRINTYDVLVGMNNNKPIIKKQDCAVLCRIYLDSKKAQEWVEQCDNLNNAYHKQPSPELLKQLTDLDSEPADAYNYQFREVRDMV